MDRDWNNYDTKVSRTKPKPEKTDWFLENLPQNAEILDFGAVIGRWASVIATKRPDITIDVLDARASVLKKHYVQIPQIRDSLECKFEDYNADREYDGIWARASLFFLPEEQLAVTLEKLSKSHKKKGVLEFSFMAPSGHDNQKSFHPLEKEKVEGLVKQAGFEIEQTIDEVGTKYGDNGIELPTYVIRARKPL